MLNLITAAGVLSAALSTSAFAGDGIKVHYTSVKPINSKYGMPTIHVKPSGSSWSAASTKAVHFKFRVKAKVSGPRTSIQSGSVGVPSVDGIPAKAVHHFAVSKKKLDRQVSMQAPGNALGTVSKLAVNSCKLLAKNGAKNNQPHATTILAPVKFRANYVNMKLGSATKIKAKKSRTATSKVAVRVVCQKSNLAKSS